MILLLICFSGVPIYSLGVSAVFCLLAYMNVSSDSAKIFGYFTNLVTIFGLLSWISILVTHIWFVNARKAQGITKSQMAYVAPMGKWGSIVALTFCIIIAVTKNFNAFLFKKPDGSFDGRKFTEEFITG